MPKGAFKVNGGCKYKRQCFRINSDLGFVSPEVPVDALGMLFCLSKLGVLFMN